MSIGHMQGVNPKGSFLSGRSSEQDTSGVNTDSSSLSSALTGRKGSSFDSGGSSSVNMGIGSKMGVSSANQENMDKIMSLYGGSKIGSHPKGALHVAHAFGSHGGIGDFKGTITMQVGDKTVTLQGTGSRELNDSDIGHLSHAAGFLSTGMQDSTFLTYSPSGTPGPNDARYEVRPGDMAYQANRTQNAPPLPATTPEAPRQEQQQQAYDAPHAEQHHASDAPESSPAPYRPASEADETRPSYAQGSPTAEVDEAAGGSGASGCHQRNLALEDDADESSTSPTSRPGRSRTAMMRWLRDLFEKYLTRETESV